jgi:transposase
MSGFVEGDDRHQVTLFPECLDDYVGEESPVRVIDLLVDDLDLSGLGFKTVAEATGRPGYHPATLLKLFIYGYLNRVHSSRRLEREAQRNVELMWLTGRLAPDFKTIADFRKDNGEAIRLVCREFVMLCRKLELFTEAFVAIDGSKFKAVNNRDKNFTKAKLKRRIQEVDQSIARYLEQLASADRAERRKAGSKAQRLEDKIAALKEEMARLKKLEVRLRDAPHQQLSLTDPDARSMKCRGSGVVGYNVQAAVDTQHHLIVAHDVTNAGLDRRLLTPMAKQAKAILAPAPDQALRAVADRGYYRGEDLLACDEAGIETYVAKTDTSGKRGKG